MLTMGLIEDLSALNRLRPPEPLMYAKGAGARGVFVPYMTMREHTAAGFLQNADIETPVFVRFSRMMGRPGSADTVRDVREFSVKFFTGEGIYDMVGSNLPVTFIKDPRKYPSLFKALSPCPKTNIHSPSQLWRFVADNPESMHMITWLYSNRGTVKSYRGMEGHSVHSYVWQNGAGEKHWVRYHWIPLDGLSEISRQEAEFLAGYDPDVAIRDLYETFEKGSCVNYELCVQLIPAKQSVENEISLLDPTVIWPESSVPYVRVGKMILRKGIENYAEDIEKCNFSPGRLVPGIELSSEPMLQALTFLALDKEGSSFRNMCQGPAGNFLNQEIAVGVSEKQNPEQRDLINGQLAWRLRSMSDKEKEILLENMGDEMLFLEESLQSEIIGYLSDASEAVAAALKKWLGLI
ncbi:catalase [Bacillota bacterium]